MGRVVLVEAGCRDHALGLLALPEPMLTRFPDLLHSAGSVPTLGLGRLRQVGDIEIRARTNADAACLMRELVSHSPRQERRVIRIALDASAPTSDLFEVLGAMEECLRGRLIGAVGGPLGPNVDVCLAARRTVVRRSLPRIYLVVARARISDLA